MDYSEHKALELLMVEREIRNLIYTYCRAVDRGDKEQLRSLYHPDAQEEHGAYQGGLEGFLDFAMACLAWTKEGLSHQITNILMEVDGDVVTAESSFICISARATDPDGQEIDQLMTGRYLDRFERRAGQWKIAHRQVAFDSNHTLKASGLWEGPLFGGFKPKGRPDETDPLYSSVAAPKKGRGA